MIMYRYPAYTWTDPRAKEMIPSPISPPNSLYQPWPYGGNYPYHVPHGCCNHTYYPYGYPPPPPTPPYHPHGFYPPFPGAYSIPPQHYSVEVPRYDYDKDYKNNHHCCGCNHPEKNDKRPEIEEESQADNKTSDSSLVPFPLLLKDRPDYPIMWLPRGYADSKVKETEHDPVMVKHPEPSKPGEDGEMAQGNRFPFQIFWLPSKNNEVGIKDTKENNLDPVANKDEKTRKNNECSGSEDECKKTHAVQKVIPVKQGGTNEDMKKPKRTENLDSVDNRSRGLPKTSKLPPVCLRIDPQPKNRKTSRSPSPRSPVNNPQQQPQVLKKRKDELSDGNIKTINHANKVELADNLPREKESGKEKGKVEEKKNLPEDEAALIIQSAYHGFQVRKSEPLKKLRQIYQVRKQVLELRNRIQDLESSSCVDGQKEAATIGEVIMSLLLKLDTIQGLHPFVREVRKAVAKELVGLQDKLDSLTSVTPSPQQRVHLAIQGKSDEAQPQSENHVHKATEYQYVDNSEDTPKLEQQSIRDDAIQHKAPTKCDTVNICENHEVKATEPQLGLHKASLPTECDDALGLCEVVAMESQGEAQLELHKEKLDQEQALTEALGLHEEEAAGGSQRGIGERELESHREMLDDECDSTNETLRLCEADEVEAAKSQEDIGEPELEPHKDNFSQVPSKCDNTNKAYEVEATDCIDIKVEQNIGELNNEQPEMHVDDSYIQDLVVLPESGTHMTCGSDVSQVKTTESYNVQKDDVSVVEMESPKGDDLVPKENEERHGGKVMKEGEKVIEELLNQRLRELTGRVKNLEKELSKKKKRVTLNKCRRQSRGCVLEKDRIIANA